MLRCFFIHMKMQVTSIFVRVTSFELSLVSPQLIIILAVQF